MIIHFQRLQEFVLQKKQREMLNSLQQQQQHQINSLQQQQQQQMNSLQQQQQQQQLSSLQQQQQQLNSLQQQQLSSLQQQPSTAAAAGNCFDRVAKELGMPLADTEITDAEVSSLLSSSYFKVCLSYLCF